MESKQSRHRFLTRCANSGGACCAILVWNGHIRALDAFEEKKEPGKKPIGFKHLSYCGIPCVQVCELYKAAEENDVKKNKDRGIESDSSQAFCCTCKMGNNSRKERAGKCEIRKCAVSNGVESCTQCKDLVSCKKGLWKTWSDLHEFLKKNQTRFLTQSGAVLLENKNRVKKKHAGAFRKSCDE